jgi:hypothetical protein
VGATAIFPGRGRSPPVGLGAGYRGGTTRSCFFPVSAVKRFPQPPPLSEKMRAPHAGGFLFLLLVAAVWRRSHDSVSKMLLGALSNSAVLTAEGSL